MGDAGPSRTRLQRDVAGNRRRGRTRGESRGHRPVGVMLPGYGYTLGKTAKEDGGGWPILILSAQTAVDDKMDGSRLRMRM